MDQIITRAQRLWSRLNPGARGLVVLWAAFMVTLLVAAATGVL